MAGDKAWLTMLTMLFLAFVPGTANGSGTPAGTEIWNQATVTYRSASATEPMTVYSNRMRVIVAQVAVVNMDPSTASGTAHLNAFADYPVTITNSGNGPDHFALRLSSSLRFAPAVYRDTDNDGLLGAAELAAGSLLQTPDLPADSSVRCVVRITVPKTLSLIGQTDVLDITAVSGYDNARSAAARRSTTVLGALLESVKGVNNLLPRAGERVTYTIRLVNGGNSAATNVIAVDQLDPRLRFVTGASTPPPDSLSGQRITWLPGPVGAGQEVSLNFEVEIANNAIPGEEIHNIAALQYQDGPNARAALSTETGFVTIHSGGPVTVEVGPAQTGTGEPGDIVQYGFTVRNAGVLPETFLLDCASTIGLTWELIHDVDADGNADPGEPASLTTDLMPAGGAYHIVARTVLPLVPADQALDVLTVRAVSTTNASNTGSSTGATTVALPRMKLTKVAAADNPRAGEEIAYTIVYANEGDGRAVEFVLTDLIPAHTAYVAGSVRLNGLVKTDQAGDDEIAVENGGLTAQIGTVMPGQSGTIAFRVRIL